MLSFIALIIPTLTSIILYIFWNRKVIIWEFLALFICSFISVGIVKLVSNNQNTTDTEFWNGTKNEVRYYEPWDEEVPCRHPIYCTEEYECGDGKTSRTCTREYVCGHYHAYDVDYHDEYWQLITSISSFNIDRAEYIRLSTLYGNKTFVELNRDFHSIDGNMYSSVWQGELDKLEIVTYEHTYENRVQSSKSVFNYPDVTPNEIKQYNLHDYPPVIYKKQRHVLGIYDKSFEHKMDILNGLLGPKKQLTSFILLFRNKSIHAAELQEAYWKGGNKNEFIVCVGVDASNNITWCKPFSWSEVAEPKITIRNFVMQQKTLDIDKLADYMFKELSVKFKRKRFRDFNYLSIPVTPGQLQAAIIVTVIFNILIAIWAVYNELEDTVQTINDKFSLSRLIERIKQFFRNIIGK